MSLPVINFRTHLEQRIAVLMNLHTSFKKKEAEQRTKIDSSLLIDEDKELAEMLVRSYNSQAAYIWDMKVELDNLLPLYDMNHPTTEDKVERTANFIAECIRSCDTHTQLEAAARMIDSLKILYGETTQVTSWVDSLCLLVNAKDKEVAL